ncbi:MAG: DUF456 domain-containing protein [Bacteroidales bacterium]|jgi:uncharacterized protein YqgC (DUF456 family)|nr:DUF456 domain-containing protein [Bacteroidales bacterium]
MDIVLFVLGILLLIVGFIGCILPVLPGQAVAFISLILLRFMDPPRASADMIWTLAGIMVVVTVLDYIVPIYGTKRFGGTKRGVWGSTIGLIFGIFILPSIVVLGPFGVFGIILGPFVGAYIGEATGNRDSREAFVAAIGSFIGFLTGTFLKLVYSGVCAYYFIRYTFEYPIW